MIEAGEVVHFLSFAMILGAAAFRVLAISRKSQTATTDIDSIYFRLAGACLLVLFATGMLNLFSVIFQGGEISREYVVHFVWKLTAILAVVGVFIADVLMSRKGPSSARRALIQLIILLIAGFLGHLLSETPHTRIETGV